MGRTLVARVVAVLRVVWLVSALPLDYRGKLRILRTMYIPAALHGIEASLLSQSNVLKLRAAFVRACWSSKLTLAHTGTVLGMLDGPECADPATCIVWFRFRMLRRYLAYRPMEVARIGRLLELVANGASGHGPLHLLVDSAAGLGIRWCPEGFCWFRPGLPRLPMVDGPYQHFQAAILDACRDLNSVNLCRRKGFRGGPLLDFRGSTQLLFSSHLRDRDKALLRGILSGGVWNGFLLGKVQGENVPCRFCGGPDGDGHLFWDCPYPPLVAIRESPEFHDVVSLDKSFWPRCLLWHGWLPALSGSDFGSPWAEGADDFASKRLEVALGSYVDEGLHDDGDFLIGGDQRELAAAPDVWSDGSLVVHEVSGVGVAGCGVYAHASGAAWFGRKWGHLDLLPPLPDGAGEACRLYCSVPGPLQTVQRAEIWGVLVALQGCLRLHVGVDNLNVVNHLAGIIAGRRVGRPFSLVSDGDLFLLAQQLVRWRGSGSSAVTKVKGHADEGLVAQGRVREVDRIGNNEADAAADLGRKRVHHSISDARRLVNRACVRWYPVVCELHRFFIAIARAALNDDGLAGTSLHPVVWSAAANPKRRRVEQAVRNFAWLPGPPRLWTARWFQVPVACIGEADVVVWPFSVSLLVKVAHFFGTLHWPCGVGDLGVGGISYLELLILYEQWAGERLVPEVAVPVGRRRGRPISVSAVPVGPGTDIGRSCMFLGSVIRILRGMPGGLERFLPCGIGAHHCRLRHLGWEKCGHGLTSRPRETSDPGFLDSLLGVFGYPAGAGRVLLDGDLPLRYYSGSFALRKPTWRLPGEGGGSHFDFC